ncbi:hypothetical protein PHYBOEH_010946 [Phytophthora boehmeriae]|uniref:Uncharacterized protein n=1 Tax=Phytophthora boehmeriae TaxID=109152 RepID=A0A8T1X3J1_9STRA|nr:hypothetical protein PHYBOEH_010946 [Phytophthora boehmeriae]
MAAQAGRIAMKKPLARFDRSGTNIDVSMDPFMMDRRPPTELTVERIPALVREVDSLMQTLVATPLTAGSSDAMDVSEELIQRAEEVDTFRSNLRPGPLQEIVGKQVLRLQEAAQHLQSPSGRLTPDLLGLGIEKPRRRQVPIRVTPFMGSVLARAAARVGVNTRKQQGAVRKAAIKPLYKWEKRRFLRGSTVAQPNVAASKASATRKSKPAEQEYIDEVDEASMELHACSEPGHYSRQSLAKATKAADTFEFQVILTEDEFKALKYQRRRLDAEQRHLARQKPQ